MKKRWVFRVLFDLVLLFDVFFGPRFVYLWIVLVLLGSWSLYPLSRWSLILGLDMSYSLHRRSPSTGYLWGFSGFVCSRSLILWSRFYWIPQSSSNRLGSYILGRFYRLVWRLGRWILLSSFGGWLRFLGCSLLGRSILLCSGSRAVVRSLYSGRYPLRLFWLCSWGPRLGLVFLLGDRGRGCFLGRALGRSEVPWVFGGRRSIGLCVLRFWLLSARDRRLHSTTVSTLLSNSY